MSEGETAVPIIIASSEEGNIEVVRLLIAAGADVNAVGSYVCCARVSSMILVEV